MMISFAWILFRPEVVRHFPLNEYSLPHELPPEIQAGPTSEEFLRDLEES